MKNSYFIPDDAPDKSQHFNHYAEAFKVLKGATLLFKPVSTLLVTTGLLLSLAILQFTPSGVNLPFGYATILPALAIGYFVWFLIGMNEKLSGSVVRYIFHGFKREGGKQWFNVPDILLHLMQLAIVGGLTFAFFNIAHNSGIAIGESLKQSQDTGVAVVAQKDSVYLAKKSEVNAKFDTLLIKRQATVNEQIAAANATLLRIPYKRKSERLEQQQKIETLTANKLLLQKEVDSLKGIDLAELAALHASTAGEIKKGNAEKAKQFSVLAEKAQKTIVGFLGFDIFIVVFGAAGLQIIKQQNGIQPNFEVEHGDFNDDPLWLEVIKKPFQILRTRIVNMSRRMYVPEQDAPTLAGAYFNKNRFERRSRVQKVKNGERQRAKMVFQNP